MELIKLNRKVVSYWILTRILLFLVVCLSIIIIIIFIPQEYLLSLLLPTGFLFLGISFYTFIMPILEYKAYRYYYDDSKIIIKGGVFFRFYRVIPIIQIQDIGTFQGPLKIIYKLSNIIISTAGSVEKIYNLDTAIAKDIVDELNSKIQKRLIEE